jgi:hypothetical protein
MSPLSAADHTHSRCDCAWSAAESGRKAEEAKWLRVGKGSEGERMGDEGCGLDGGWLERG